MELKIRRKNPGTALRQVKHLQSQAFCFFEMSELDFHLFTVIADGYPGGTCGVSQYKNKKVKIVDFYTGQCPWAKAFLR